mmetsp:Transcript_17094/g.58438  ORF Transcript_17094/g.58438 Transcript_17094/m.58438 type:complete len:298 (+) Transcript_17094:229-1122(+)
MAAPVVHTSAPLGGHEQKVLDAVGSFQDGCTNSQLQAHCEREFSLTATALATVLNQLLTKRRVQIYRADGADLYKAVSQEEALKFKGLSSEDMLVYQIIQTSGNQGIWTKDMKVRSNLQQPQITKILKALEQRQLIKAVKSVTSKNRKVYMCYELEPSAEVSGGAWYTDDEFDAEFVNVARDQCREFVERRGSAALEQIMEFVGSSEVFHVNLGEEDVLQIVNTLVYDGHVDANPADGTDEQYPKGTVVYTPSPLRIPESSAFTSMPCGVCPVFNDCQPGGLVSPETCVYYQKWLDF